MNNTMIEVFSRLTQPELDDYSLFEDVLGNHFEKFRYFYWSTASIAEKITRNVTSISGFCSDQTLTVEIEFKTEKSRKQYLEAIGVYEDVRSSFFTMNTEVINSKTLNILIENNTISREGEIYENRLNPC